MSSTGIKRQMQASIQPQNVVSEDVAALSTIGMRIRKAVSDGYSVPNANNYSYSNNMQRVPLPSHLDQPPSLTNMGSTLDSSSSCLAEWDSRYQINNAPLQTIDQGINYNKRKLDDSEDLYNRGTDAAMYASKYGELKFHEDF
ncbi:uncharacterized protein RJT21DRAFT_120627 [Scheffersomyces amazonensis]|uniref:uncharacterized protein n=1 Tax=Scheffersomyces amazonensis TaxID=1078765 RepID=UPI00315CAD9A